MLDFLKKLYRIINPTPERALLRALRRQRLGQREVGVELPSGRVVRGMKPLEAYNEYKDIFIKGIYRFSPSRPNPVIIDAGAYVGFSAIYFLQAYEDAHLTLFECDPEILETLKLNLQDDEDRYELVEKALAGKEGEATFHRSGDDGGSLFGSEGSAFSVQTTTLLPWLEQEVDFLKMNIEGAEMEALRACGPSLRKVREMVIEFHSFPGRDQELSHLLNTLKMAGFRYLVNHYDADSNFACEPPFHLDKDTEFVLLVYAKRDDLL